MKIKNILVTTGSVLVLLSLVIFSAFTFGSVDSEIKIDSFSTSIPSTLSLTAGETYDLNADVNVSPAEIRSHLSYTSTDKDVAIISVGGKITAVSAGSCQIKIQLLDEVLTLDLVVIAKSEYAISPELEHNELIISLDSIGIKNILNLNNENFNQTVNVSVIPNIASYDYNTGIITPISSGEAIVTASIEISEGEFTTLTYKLTVTDLPTTMLNNILVESVEQDGGFTLTIKLKKNGVIVDDISDFSILLSSTADFNKTLLFSLKDRLVYFLDFSIPSIDLTISCDGFTDEIITLP